MSLKITIDPGHGKNVNKSPNNKAYIEGTQMWKLANELKKALESYGFEVVTTRPNIDDNPSLSARGSMAGKNGSCLFLSLHSNAPGKSADGTYSKLATGSVVFYSMTRKENKALADKLGKKVSEIMGHYYRGSQTKQYPNQKGVDYYGVIRSSAQSGCKCALLVEHGFHTNLSDSNFLLDDGNLQKIAEAEASIIAEYFGQKKINKKTVEEIAKEVINGKWGSGTDRKSRLEKAGYSYAEIQTKVNEILKGTTVTAKKTVDEVAREVINGKWGNGATRKKKLTVAGYDYNAVQKRVNELLK